MKREMQVKRDWKKVLILLIIGICIVQMGLGFVFENETTVHAHEDPLHHVEDGFLYLKTTDPKDRTVDELHGEWDFYWNQFVDDD